MTVRVAVVKNIKNVVYNFLQLFIEDEKIGDLARCETAYFFSYLLAPQYSQVLTMLRLVAAQFLHSQISSIVKVGTS